MQTIAIGIQARSSSKRFPRKTLQNLFGLPLIAWVLEGCKKTGLPVWVLTSDDSSDDELAEISLLHGAEVFRGNLNNVFYRYKEFSEVYGFSHVIRINGDSPLIASDIIHRALEVFSVHETADLVTNVFPRTFPKGQSVEIIRSATLQELVTSKMTDNDFEHVTSFFYDNYTSFQISNFRSDSDLSHVNLCVDFPRDFYAIESFLDERNILSPAEVPAWSDLSSLIQEYKIDS
jgi:spore coat polysaccharide biosynthesis protein SpsF (cytidylyltransferase family)